MQCWGVGAPPLVCSPPGAVSLCSKAVCKGSCWLLRLFCVFMLYLAQEGECCSHTWSGEAPVLAVLTCLSRGVPPSGGTGRGGVFCVFWVFILIPNKYYIS